MRGRERECLCVNMNVRLFERGRKGGREALEILDYIILLRSVKLLLIIFS